MIGETYHRYSQEDLGLNNNEWKELVAFLDRVREPINRLLSSRGTEGVEEDPPRISSDDEFVTGGWVGTYPSGISVYPDRVERDAYESMLAEVSGWIESVSMQTVDSLLPFLPEPLLDRQALLLRYSEYLIEYTEVVLAERLPVDVVQKTSRGRELRGRPDFDATLRERSRGTQLIVSQETEFSLASLPNLLLVRFHAELQQELDELRDQFESHNQQLNNQLKYHRSFLNQELPTLLLDKSLETQFTDPTVLDETRRLANEELKEIVDLWEAYQKRQSMEVDITEKFSNTLKPASKVYELWCLVLLIDSISELIGEAPSTEGLSSTFKWGSGATLYYNRSITKHSNYIGPNFAPRPGKPDFALSIRGKLQWVGDAKFKPGQNLSTSDYQRFISYLIDYLPVESVGGGSILYLGDVDQSEIQIEQHQFTHTILHPDDKKDAKDALLGEVSPYFENSTVSTD